MSINFATSLLFGGNNEDYGDYIAYSCRFNDDDSPEVQRTPGGAGTSTTKATVSFWTKLGTLPRDKTFSFSTIIKTTSNAFVIGLYDTSNYGVNIRTDGSSDSYWGGYPRDQNGWTHVCVGIDTTQATSDDRYKVYVNGILQSRTSGTVAAQNSAISLNSVTTHHIGRDPINGVYFDGYLADFIIVDGQTLDASYFGRTAALSGEWVPKNYTGTYGINGVRLQFANSANFGEDTSGNGNNFTPSGLTSADQMYDSPSNNYCTLVTNYIATETKAGTSEANLRSIDSFYHCTTGWELTTGKWYFEALVHGTAASVYPIIGIWKGLVSLRNTQAYAPGYYAQQGYGYGSGGLKYYDTGSAGAAYGSTFTTNDIISCAFDCATGNVWWAKNGTWQASGNPETDANSAFTMTGGIYTPGAGGNGTAVTFIFGQRPFSYTPPTGFKAINSRNLSELSVTLSGSFTASGSADGPVINMQGYPSTLTINSSSAISGTDYDRLANGFKLRTASSPFNNSGTKNWTATIGTATKANRFKFARSYFS